MYVACCQHRSLHANIQPLHGRAADFVHVVLMAMIYYHYTVECFGDYQALKDIYLYVHCSIFKLWLTVMCHLQVFSRYETLSGAHQE